MKIEIICGKKGCGKTTYIKKTYPYERYIHAEQFVDSSSVNHNIFFDASTIILDEAEKCCQSVFNTIINNCKIYNVNKVMLLVDLTNDELLKAQNILSLSDIDGVSRNLYVEEYVAPEEELKAYIQYNYQDLSNDEYDEIISITGYNFSEIDALMLRMKLSGGDNNEKNEVAIKSYLKKAISERFKDISEDIYSIIEKSSVMGSVFSALPLESVDGFGIKTAEEYLKETTRLRFLIRACENAEHQYEFPLMRIYEAVFDTISIGEKNKAAQILVSYYSKQYQSNASTTERIRILNRMLQAQKLCDKSSKKIQKIRLELLYLYSITKDWEKLYFVANEALCDQEIQPLYGTMLAYTQEICVRALKELGRSKQAIKILKKIHKEYSNLFLFKYRLALYLYDSGDIDNSFAIAKELVNNIRSISNEDNAMNRLICNAYSLMVTLQNHLSLEDKGARYFRLALNRGKMHENTLYEYYSCLKKCGMFYQHNEEIQALEEAAAYFEEINSVIDAGEVYLNIATEMLFHGGYEDTLIENYFKKALERFGHNSLKLSYVYNNIGIFFVLAKENAEEALEYFRKAKLLGLSDFTYMTINLNICMCDLLLDIEPLVFSQDYRNFMNTYESIASRENATAYENQYRNLLDAITMEHHGKSTVQLCHNHLLTSDEFFSPIWKDILSRQLSVTNKNATYPDNHFFYEQINRQKIFLAEFRYWE